MNSLLQIIQLNRQKYLLRTNFMNLILDFNIFNLIYFLEDIYFMSIQVILTIEILNKKSLSTKIK